MSLDQLRSDSMVAGLATIVSYAAILLGMFLVLFVVPYLIYVGLG